MENFPYTQFWYLTSKLKSQIALFCPRLDLSFVLGFSPLSKQQGTFRFYNNLCWQSNDNERHWPTGSLEHNKPWPIKA